MINTRILMKINCILLFISITLAHLQFIEKHSGTHILITVDATGTETIGEFYGKVKNALVTQKQDERIFRLLYAGEYIDETLATTSLADKSISIIEECTIEIEFSSIMRLNTNDPDVQFWFDEEMDALNFSKMDPMKTVVNISDNVELEFLFRLEHRLFPSHSRLVYWACPNMQCSIFKRVYQDTAVPTFKKFRFKSFANPPTIVSSQQHTSMKMIVILGLILGLILGIRLLITCVCRKEIKLTKINNDEKV
eukprot:176920_1